MLMPGQLVMIRILCPNCGAPSERHQVAGSTFYSISCNNPECEMHRAEVLIERSTNTVVTVIQWQWRSYDGNWYRVVTEPVPKESKPDAAES